MGSRDILNQHADRIYKAISDIVYDAGGSMSLSIGIGDRVRVIDQDWITGTVVEDWGNRLVIIDDDAETDDDRLEFYVSDLKQIEEDS